MIWRTSIRRLAWYALPALTALAGCSARNGVPRADFAPVAAEVERRLGGQRVSWTQGVAEDEQAAQAIEDLLAGPLHVDEAVQIALLNNRSLRASFEELGIAQADLVQAGLLSNPVIAGSARFATSGSGTNIEMSGVHSLLEILVLPARKRVAAAQYEQARLRVTQSILDVAADTAAAFYDLQAAEQLRDLQQGRAEAAAVRDELARRQHELGDISDLELARQQAALRQAELEVRAAAAHATSIRARLSRFMGLARRSDWSIAADSPTLPATDPELDELLTQAIEQRLDLAMAQNEVQTVDNALGLARKGLLTQVELGAGGERELEGTWAAGPEVRLEIPVFDQRQAQIARLEAQLQQARHHVNALRDEIVAHVLEAHANMQAARAAVEHLESAVIPLRRRIAELSQQHFDAKRVGIYELLAARQDEVEAQSDHIKAIRDYWLARIELQRAVGGVGAVIQSRP